MARNKDPVKQSARHHRPISCYSCRARKLRCSRKFPCANCTARGLDCRLHVSQPPLAAGLQDDSSTEPVSSNDDGSTAEILSRLRRLEDIVLKKEELARSHSSATEPSQTKPVTNQVPTLGRDTRKRALSDAEWLQRECLNYTTADSKFAPDEFVFRTCPIRQVSEYAAKFYSRPHPTRAIGSIRYVWLPQYEEAKILLEKYVNDITYFHHIIHAPSVRMLLDRMYGAISHQTDVKPGDVALFLSIFSSSTFQWTVLDDQTLFQSVSEAHGQAELWTTAALDVLDYSRRTTFGLVEDVQAMVILGFVACSLEGSSPRFWSLFSSAISLARQLSLHRIDHPSHAAGAAASKVPPPSSVQIEIQRRVWWYLAATDWLMSRYAGPFEGSYTINPRHMAVNMPLNIDDEDLVEGKDCVGLDLSQPTSMSCFLQRVRMGELYRELTDRISSSNFDSDKFVYGQVMEFDGKIENFIRDMPAFFKLHEDQRISNDPPNPAIVVPRYMLNEMIFSHRCKLHVQYLSQASANPEYARSRQIALHSARMIIRADRLMERENVPFVLTRLKFGGALYTRFMAIVVLVMDLCFHKKSAGAGAAHGAAPDLEAAAAAADDDDDDEWARKAELADACRILEKAREQSPIATKLLELLMSVLRKHKVSVPDLEGAQLPRRPSFPGGRESGNIEYDVSRPASDPIVVGNDVAAYGTLYSELPSCFDEIWQSFESGMDVDSLAWADFFSGLDSQM